jgi:hypothetical protein
MRLKSEAPSKRNIWQQEVAQHAARQEATVYRATLSGNRAIITRCAQQALRSGVWRGTFVEFVSCNAGEV